MTGFRTERPTLPFASVDHHELVLEAFRRIVALGYRRPALVVGVDNDRLVDGRFSSAMWLAQQALAPADRVPRFSTRRRAALAEAGFARWHATHRPDVVLALDPRVLVWLAAMGGRVPEDTGVVLLERRGDHPGCASMDQHNDIAGQAAIDMVINMLHGHERGFPLHPRATLIGATWSPGSSVREQHRG